MKKELIAKIDRSHELHTELEGNFGRTMTITMEEAMYIKRVLISKRNCNKCHDDGRFK